MRERATASQLPWRDGDGYSYGGEAILTIGHRSIMVGAGKEAFALAQEIAARWNLGFDDIPDTSDGENPCRDSIVEVMRDFEDFINQPPQYEDQRMVRDYRHELYRKWEPLCRKLISHIKADTEAKQ